MSYELSTTLRQLKLTGMAQALHEQLERPPQAALSFEERLSLLLERELTYRQDRRISTLLRQAKLRQQARLEDINYDHPRKLNKSHFLSLARCDFIRQSQNLLITAPTGCGKSYIACALGHQACRQGLSVRYLRLPRFLEELMLAHADGSFRQQLQQLSKVDLLILDDFGLVPLTAQQRQDLFNVIEDRHQLKATLITSQLPIKHWHEAMGEPTIADAILDRLLENAHRIELEGGSLRQTQVQPIASS